MCFLLVDDLDPHGGCTAVLDGSPQLISRLAAAKPELAKRKHKDHNQAIRNASDYLKRLTDTRDASTDREAVLHGT